MPASLGGIKLGKAFVLIEAVDRTGRVLNSIKQRIGRFAAEMSQMGTMMALRAAAALTPVGFSLATYAKFDDAMRKVQARSRGTGDEMNRLRAQAKELGRTTAFTASHIGDLQARLAQFGLNRSEIESITEPIMLLARAGGEGFDLRTDILQSTDAVTQLLAAYSLGASHAGKVTDLLSATINNSKFSLEELSTSLQHAAPASAQFGVTMEDMLASLAAIRELGFDASIVGTAYRNMMIRMSTTPNQERFNKTLKELTGNTIDFTDSAGNLRRPVEILMELNNVLKDVGNAASTSMLSRLFELRAAVPSMGLMRSKDKLAEMLAILSDVEETAKRTHDEMESGIGGAWRMFVSAIEGVAIALGEGLDPMMRSVGRLITEYLGIITAWIMKNSVLIATVIAGIAAFGALGIALVITGQSLMAATIILTTLASITGAVATAITTLFALLGTGGGSVLLAAAALLFLAANFERLKEVMVGSLSSFVSSWKDSLSAIGAALTTGNIEDAFKILTIKLKLQWLEFIDYIKSTWEGLKDTLGVKDNLFETPGAVFTVDVGKELQSKDSLKLRFLKAYDEFLRTVPGDDAGRAKARAELLELIEAEEAAARASTELQQVTPEPATISAAAQARRKEIEQLEKDLQQLKDKYTLQPWTITITEDSPAVDFSKWRDMLDKMSSFTSTIPESVTGHVSPDIVEGVRKGSVEAARELQKARFNEQKNQMAKLIEIEEGSKGILEEMSDKLDELAGVGGV